jgi:hypothetical protein
MNFRCLISVGTVMTLATACQGIGEPAAPSPPGPDHVDSAQVAPMRAPLPLGG